MSEKNPQYRVNAEIWRAGQNVVGYRPALAHCHDKPDGTKYRGAQVMSISGGNMTLKIQLEPSFVGERTVAHSSCPRDRRRRRGSPDHRERRSRLHRVLEGKPTCPSDQAARVGRGEFWPAAIPDALY